MGIRPCVLALLFSIAAAACAAPRVTVIGVDPPIDVITQTGAEFSRRYSARKARCLPTVCRPAKPP